MRGLELEEMKSACGGLGYFRGECSGDLALPIVTITAPFFTGNFGFAGSLDGGATGGINPFLPFAGFTFEPFDLVQFQLELSQETNQEELLEELQNAIRRKPSAPTFSSLGKSRGQFILCAHVPNTPTW